MWVSRPVGWMRGVVCPLRQSGAFVFCFERIGAVELPQILELRILIPQQLGTVQGESEGFFIPGVSLQILEDTAEGFPVIFAPVVLHGQLTIFPGFLPALEPLLFLASLLDFLFPLGLAHALLVRCPHQMPRLYPTKL